jgi:Domain of unknown function (DUF4440)
MNRTEPRLKIRTTGRSLTLFLSTGLAVGMPVTVLQLSANISSSDEAKNVAALDTQYQAAVQRNDTATMAGILAEDFVLATGSGKTYTKSDLLNEARSGRVMYERQKDDARTVRVWGPYRRCHREIEGERNGERQAFRIFALVQ